MTIRAHIIRPAAVALAICAILSAAAAAEQPPAAERMPVSDTRFGETLTDPYRWMEAGGPEFDAWAKAQGAATRAALSSLPGYADLAREIAAASAAEVKVSALQRVGDRLYFERQGRGEEQASLWVRQLAGGEERRLVDPVKLGDATTAITDYAVSPDGRRLAYALSRGGSEEATLRIMELETGRVLPEVLDRARFAGPVWSGDGSLLFYDRLKAEFSGPEDRFSDQTVYRHRPGEDPAADAPVFTAAAVDSEVGPAAFVGILLPPGSAYALAFASHGVSPEAEWFTAPAAALSSGGTPAWRRIARLDDLLVLFLNGEASAAPAVRGHEAWFASLKDAPSGQVVKIDLDGPGAAQAQVVAPERAAPLTGFAAASDGVYLAHDAGGEQTLTTLGFEGAAEAPLASPYAGTIANLAADPREPGAVLTLESWARPAQAFAAEGGALRDLGLAPPFATDLSAIVADTILAVAKDGVQVPVTVIRRKDVAHDGAARALVDGYGAYGVALKPVFRSQLMPLLLRGDFVWAVVHARGGGEFGERWHLAGKEATKPNTWRDYIAGVEKLEADGWISPGRVAGLGQSAGGILMGRAITERPDLLAAAVMWAPIVNTLRFEGTEGGPANIAEFGSVATQPGYAALRAMDPYSHVEDGTAYPATLITIGLNDHRVPPWMGAEMAARMQAATSSGKPVLLRVDEEGGHHVMGVSKTDMDAQITDTLAFVLEHTGDPAFQRR